MVDSFVHPENTPFGIEDTVLVNLTVSNPVQLANAKSPIEVIPEGRLVSTIFEQFLNAYCPIEVIPEGRLVNDSLGQSLNT